MTNTDTTNTYCTLTYKRTENVSLIATLLMALQLGKKRKKTMILPDDVSGNLTISNTEMPGTDCEVIKFTDLKKLKVSKRMCEEI